MQTVTFGTKNSYSDFGLILTSKEIGFPEPKLEQINLAGMDGVLDLSESLTDDIKFETRLLTFTFAVINPILRWSGVVSEVANYLHGKRIRINMDFDSGYYYVGRCKINSFKSEKRIGELVIECECDPYKVEVNATGEYWIWDTFSFVNGFIRTNEIEFTTSKTVNLQNLRKVVSPTFICSKAMTVSFNGKTYNLSSGSNTIYDIRLQEGTNYVTFNCSGTGKVKIEYQGGGL